MNAATQSSADGSASKTIDGYVVPSHGIGRLKPFKKGQSGNPGGHQGEYQLARRICADNTVAAIQRQLELMRSDDERVAFMATEAILNRGIGKPRDHSTEDQARTIVNLDNLSDDERALLAKLMGKVLPKDAP